MSAKIVVRAARLGDLGYIDHVTRSENYRTAALGFLPQSAYEAVITGIGTRSRLWVAEADDDQVGYLYLTPGQAGGSAKIVQVAVQEDARRNEYGTALVNEAERYASTLRRGGVSCSVATDLEAGRFWDAVGFELRRIVPGGNRRGRLLERRFKCLPVPLI